jgi:two-component system OmpR family response regulator
MCASYFALPSASVSTRSIVPPATLASAAARTLLAASPVSSVSSALPRRAFASRRPSRHQDGLWAVYESFVRPHRRFTRTAATMWHMSTTKDRHRILVVDDEPSIVDAVATALRYEGYEVEEAYNGRQALDAVTREEPDLIVLDWMLPDIEGIEVGRRLRARGFKSAVLFLTAKDETENKVEALRAGGDDYVTKPFSLAEIVARTQAILRRTIGALPGDVLRFDDVVLDEARHEVHRGGASIELTATEFSLLRYFMLNPRRVLSKTQILQNVWRYDFGGNSNVVETYVSYLRKKLDTHGSPLIKTVRQAGYMLDAGTD